LESSKGRTSEREKTGNFELLLHSIKKSFQYYAHTPEAGSLKILGQSELSQSSVTTFS
jgi:hypothetical protein